MMRLTWRQWNGENPYRVIDIAFVFLESTAIWDGWNQDSGFLRVTTDADSYSAATLLKVG